MSETLRDLVVSLSLQSDNFTRNIKSVNKQIQEAESYFRLATAGVENFENTASGLVTHLSTLERKLTLQKTAVTQYQGALDAANTKLQECYDRQVQYAQRLEDAKKAQQSLKDQVKLAAQQVKQFSNTLGESDSATIAAHANLDALKGEYRESVKEVKKVAGQNTALKKSTQNAADAVTTATTQLNKARAAVKVTQSEIDRCNQSLALAQTNWNTAGEAIENSKAALVTIGKQMQVVQSRFKLASAGVKNFDKSAEGLTAKLTLLNEKLSLQEKSVTEYEKALAAAKVQLQAAQDAHDPDKIKQASDAVLEAEAALMDAQAAVKETTAEIDDCSKTLKTAQSAWAQAGKSLESFGKKCDTVSKTMTTAGRTLTTVMTTPILALGTAAIKASISYESAFASVRKTVNATEAEYAHLSGQIKQMSTQVATSSNSTDIVASEAASTLAKFANIMNMDQSKFGNLGAALVDLGNKYATTESAIMNMAMRLAGAGHQVGLSEAQILGFAAALSSLGIEAEMGGSAFSKALVKMEVAAAAGGEALDDFAKVSGMTAEQFKAMWDADPAGAFQAFIEGLAKMDEEGMSAIATLNEIGIVEVRLRDTLLRATNANELFTRTQQTANAAWEENTALVEEAGKRYATTESKLTNLKNKAVLFGRQIGDDLNPIIHDLIDGADELLEKFMDLDEAQRMQIIQFAAIAAAAGPAMLAFGKITKGVGTISTAIGKFSSAVGTAGGGWKGLLSVLSKSPAVWMAVAAAVTVGTAALIDYVSDAKQAREAMKGMQETADSWKNTAADTFYGKSEGLSFFGMSEADFERSGQNAQEWVDGVIKVWTDGQKESDAIVNEWTSSFKALTASTREELEEMKAAADEAGYTGVSDQLQSDIEQLDAMDKEIERLLKRRQNGYFSEKEKIRLQELIDAREAIEVKYKLSAADVGGFDAIRQKLEAEVARAQARGKEDADASVYENAMVAAAEGLAAVDAQIDAQYDKEYALIQLIEDSTERQAALDELNLKYNNDRRNAALEYAALLSDVVTPVWEQEDIQKAAADIETLNELTANMDEGALTEYIAMLTQIQSLLDSGMTEGEVQALFPEVDFSTALEQIASIQSFLNNRQVELPGLTAMFGEALPEEVLTIATDLDMTGAQARWDEFAANPGEITTDAVIASYQENEETQKLQPVVDAFIARYTEVPEGASTAELTPEGLVAYVAAYAEATTGADVTSLNPANITAMISAYEELAEGADVTALKPDQIVGYVYQYMEKQGVDTTQLKPEDVTAFVMAYEEVTGGASTQSLTPTNIAAMVTKYLLAENVDVSKISDAQVDAIVNAYAEATGCDKSALKAEVIAQITAYEDAEGVSKPSVIPVKLSITGYDLAAYNEFIRNNPVVVTGRVRLGEVYENPQDVLKDENARFYDMEGQQIPVDIVPREQITADTLFLYNEDGTMHVLVTPEVQGTSESAEQAAELLNSLDHQGSIGAKWFGDDTMTDIQRLSEYLVRINNEMNSILNIGGWMNSWDRKAAADTISNYLDVTEIGNIQAFVQEAVTALNSGEQLSEDVITKLQSIQQLAELMNSIGVGENILAGIAEGMTEGGTDTTAETVASNLETALNTALGIQSPATRMKPVGENVSAGVGAGMTGYDFTADATATATALDTAMQAALTSTTLSPVGTTAVSGLAQAMTAYSMTSTGATIASSIQSAVNSSLTSTTLRSAGVNAMAGLKAGINAGKSGVVSSIRAAAQAAVNAAKAALKIHSPSEVFEDEVGVMTMRGWGVGVLKETRNQAKIIRNASRYLTGEAREGAIAYNTSDNRRTYNNSVHSTIQVAQMVIRDEQDIRSLAVEIATLTRRQQRGKGLRMA